MQRTFTRLLFLGTVFFSVQSFGQLAPYYTHYMLNKLAYNPAVAGEKDAICVNGLAHVQWFGMAAEDPTYKGDNVLPGATNPKVNPATQAFSITAPILKNNQMGVGLQVVNDKIGYTTALYMKGSLSYKYGFGRKIPSGNKRGYDFDQTLAVGADFGMIQIGLDGTKYNPIDPSDPKIPTAKVAASSFDMGAGLYYTNQSLFDGFYAGVSMTSLTAPNISLPGLIDFKTERYLYVLAGSEHSLGSVSLLPSVLIRSQAGAGMQVDLTGRVKFGQKLVAGVGLRSSDALYLMLGYYIKDNLYVGYSYDANALSKSALGYTRAGTNELFVSYCFDINFDKPPVPVKPRYNVRYLEGYTY